VLSRKSPPLCCPVFPGSCSPHPTCSPLAQPPPRRRGARRCLRSIPLAPRSGPATPLPSAPTKPQGCSGCLPPAAPQRCAVVFPSGPRAFNCPALVHQRRPAGCAFRHLHSAGRAHTCSSPRLSAPWRQTAGLPPLPRLRIAGAALKRNSSAVPRTGAMGGSSWGHSGGCCSTADRFGEKYTSTRSCRLRGHLPGRHRGWQLGGWWQITGRLVALRMPCCRGQRRCQGARCRHRPVDRDKHQVAAAPVMRDATWQHSRPGLPSSVVRV